MQRSYKTSENTKRGWKYNGRGGKNLRDRGWNTLAKEEFDGHGDCRIKNAANNDFITTLFSARFTHIIEAIENAEI